MHWSYGMTCEKRYDNNNKELMQARIEVLGEKILVGKRMKMSLSKNKTAELWKCFMPRQNEIPNKLTVECISMQVYPLGYYANFNPNTEFEKWASVEVSDSDSVPDNMEHFVLEGGDYAVFVHKGSSSDMSTFQFIFTDWIPNSDYQLDHRPHFEILGEKYKNNDPSSEEEIWIPIVKKEAK